MRIIIPYGALANNFGYAWRQFGRLRGESYRIKGGSRTAVTSKMEEFPIIVNGFEPLTITTKRSILAVATVLDPPLLLVLFST